MWKCGTVRTVSNSGRTGSSRGRIRTWEQQSSHFGTSQRLGSSRPVRKKQPQQNNKQAPSKSSNNNKYKVLASDPEEEVNALNSKDAEPAPRESSKGSKGKSPSIPNYSRQTPNQGKPPENRPRNREMPASSSKGRGGSQTAFRGKGRGQGRNGSSNQPRRATLNEWFDHLGSDGVFQFGRSQPSTSGQERDNGTFTGSAQPLRREEYRPADLVKYGEKPYKLVARGRLVNKAQV
nr:LINE-type retrotransposon LIb DNA [Ipomoea batatas]